MSKSTSNTESNENSTSPATETSPTGYDKVDPTPTEPVEAVEDYGYDTGEEKPVVEEKVNEPEPTEEAEVKDPATGYKAKEGEEAKQEEAKPEDKESGDVAKEIESVLGELPEGYDKKTIADFAVEHKLNKEQVAAYVELTKREVADGVAAREAEIKTTRAAWSKELMTDPEFGGEHFDLNVDRVEKVLQNYLPNMKKELTSRGTMLPPYMMRDLLSLAKTLNPTNALVNGEASKPITKEENFLTNLYE